jgi:alanyl aminopeptidase
MLDADDAGYYHAGLGGKALSALLQRGYPRLQVGEKLAVIRDLGALAASADLPAGEVLGHVPELLTDPSPEVLEATLALVTRIRDVDVPAALRPNLARYVQKTFGERARAVGWTAKAGEDDRVRMLRPTLMPVVSDRGDDRALLAEARSLADRWLGDPAAVPPDLVDSVLSVAASRGDRALFDRLVALVRSTKDEAVKRRAVRALASFRDPALVRASLALFLGDDLDPRLGVDLLFQDEHAVAVVFEFLQKNFDAVVARTPNDLRATLPALAEPFCDGARRAEVEAFFKDRVAKLTGAPRALSRALERIALCEAQAKAAEPSLAAFLGRM